jgi:hypothetical protein
MKFNPTRIRYATDDDKNKAEVTLSFIFDKDSWDEGTLNEDKKVAIGAYVTTYDKLRKVNTFSQLSNVMLNCEKIDFDNPSHKRIFDYYKSCFKADSGQYFETQWHCEYKCGSQEEEITMDDLSDDQKLQIELGLATFEQIKKDMRGSAFGNRINQLWLVRPTNKFDNSVNQLTDYIEDDFFIINETIESKDDLFTDKVKEESIDALFGGR